MRITAALPTTGAIASPAAIAKAVVSAERRGHESVWVVERLLRPLPRTGGPPVPGYYATVYDPLVVLSWAAAQTRRITLGASVFDALFRPPPLLARQLATLDQLSGGRLWAGLGQGWIEDEYDAAGISMRGRGARFEEYLQLLAACWRPDPVSFDGTHYTIPPSEISPKPTRDTGVPLLIGAISLPAVRRAGRLGLDFNPVLFDDLESLREQVTEWRAAAIDAGHDPAARQLVVRTNRTLTADDDDHTDDALSWTLAQATDVLDAIAELRVDEVFFEVRRTDVPVERQLDLVDAIRRRYDG
jgi:probable F420-dependent oxidoreductase